MERKEPQHHEGRERITFDERPIYEAPLEVLRHLYYYTTQYGLSVRQFTGQHHSYWEKLPQRLRQVQHSPEDLNAVIEELEKLAEGADERLRRRKAQKDRKWAEKEIILNAQLLSVFAAMPRKLLALGFQNVTGDTSLPDSFRIVDVLIRSEEGKYQDFVEPDLLLLGSNHLLMVEIKTRGGATSSRNYPPRQLLNYFRLVAECRDSGDASLPSQFTHLILVPSIDPKWLENHSDWVLDACDLTDGRLRVDPDACIRLGRRGSSYNYDLIRGLLSEVPIYYRSWDQLDRAFESAIEQFNDQRNQRHWQRIGREISVLAVRAGLHK